MEIPIKPRPISVVISALLDNNKILLIKRAKGDFANLWGLPGGKIEINEHLCEAAVREILEESGINSDFNEHLSIVSEHIIENNEIKHFLLHVCSLVPKTTEITTNNSGELRWFNLDNIKDLEDKIIPSDFLMIEKIIKNKEKNYFISKIKKDNGKYIQLEFR